MYVALSYMLYRKWIGLLLKYKLWKLRKDTSIIGQYEKLLVILQSIDNQLFDNIPANVKLAIRMDLGVRSIAVLHRDLILLHAVILDKGYVPESIQTYANNRRTISFDEFFVDAQNRTVDVAEVHIQLTYLLRRNVDEMKNAEKLGILQRYFLRKTDGLYKDLVVIVEALRKVALKT